MRLRSPSLDWLFARPWRVVAIVALVVGVPLLALGQLSANSTRQRLRDDQLNETRAVATRAADAVSSRATSLLEQLSLALSISDLRPALEQADSERVSDLLQTFHRRMTGDIARIFALDHDLRVVALDPPDGSQLGKAAAQRDNLVTLRRANLRADNAFFSDLYRSQAGGAPTVAVAVAVLSPRGREGPFSGALVAELEPRRIAAWLAPLLGSADEVYLVDRAGKVIVRASDPDADRERDLGADPIVSEALAHRAVTAEANDPFGNGRRFVSTVELDRLGWHIVVERSTANLDTSVDEVVGQLFVNRLVLVAVLLAMSYLVAAALRQVHRLEQREQGLMRRSLDRMKEQLRIARDIQTALLPKALQPPAGWALEAYYQPAADVGGDFYDVIYLPDGRQGLAVGDVTGHGVGAALLMASTMGTLRAEAPLSDSPGEVLSRVNNRLCVEIPAGTFVTCLYAVLDPATGELRFANAGHPVPYVRTGAGVVEAKARGMPLGLIPGSIYEERQLTLGARDHCLFYTDGVTEARRDSEMFGGARLKQLVAEGPAGRLFIDLLLRRLREMTGLGWEQEDDITLLTLERLA